MDGGLRKIRRHFKTAPGTTNDEVVVDSFFYCMTTILLTSVLVKYYITTLLYRGFAPLSTCLAVGEAQPRAAPAPEPLDYYTPSAIIVILYHEYYDLCTSILLYDICTTILLTKTRCRNREQRRASRHYSAGAVGLPLYYYTLRRCRTQKRRRASPHPGTGSVRRPVARAAARRRSERCRGVGRSGEGRSGGVGWVGVGRSGESGPRRRWGSRLDVGRFLTQGGSGGGGGGGRPCSGAAAVPARAAALPCPRRRVGLVEEQLLGEALLRVGGWVGG